MRICEKKNTNSGLDGDCLGADIRLAVYYGIKRMEELLPANPAKAYISWVFLLKNSGSHPRYSYFALLVL